MPVVENFSLSFYPANDIARTREFYEEFLEFGEGKVTEYENGDWFVKYVVRGAFLLFSNHYQDLADYNYKAGCISLEVESLDETLEHFKKHGIAAIEESPGTILRKSPTGHFFRIPDPYGNIVIMHHDETSKFASTRARLGRLKSPK